jgi:hypothetical protein
VKNKTLLGIWALALGLFLPCAALATTTVSGSLKDLGTNAITSNSFVRFTLRGCSGNQPTVPGVAVLAGPGMPYFKDFTADSSGNVSGTLYSTRDAAGTGNGEIQCGVSFTSTFYGMTVYVAGKGGPEMAVHAKNGQTLNIGTVTPISVTPVATAPTGDTTYARLDGGNQPFSGPVTAPNVTATALVKGSQVQSTVATGTAPLIVASTTVVPNLNAQLHGGLTAPASAILGLTDTQAPTNKTIDISLNTVKNSSNTAGHYQRNNGTQYVDATIAAADLPATTSNCTGQNFAQGLNAGGTPVCTATTPGIAVNQSDQTLLSANSGTITLTTPGANGFYQIDCYVIETRAATTSSTLPQCQVLYTDADSSNAFTFQLTNTTSINAAGVAGQPVLQPWMFYAKSGVAIQYNSTGYLSNGATSMQYAMHVRLLGPF